MDLWVEAYRPATINDMVLPDDQRLAFEGYIEKKSIPHLLFFGAPGSGKTTMAKIFINKLPCTSMTLNASSNDRGIDVIKGRIKDFASSNTLPGKDLKIIFLDEADGLTRDAQDALRNTIETYAETCRFILTANSFAKIRPALQSRCTNYEFSTFSKTDLVEDCLSILEGEEIMFSDSDVQTIVDRLYPDIRSIINNLQKCSASGTLDTSGLMAFNVSEDEITEMILNGRLRDLREAWAGAGSYTWLYGFLFNDFIMEVSKEALRADIALDIAEYLYRDATIADKEINATGCVVAIMMRLEVEIIF